MNATAANAALAALATANDLLNAAENPTPSTPHADALRLTFRTHQASPDFEDYGDDMPRQFELAIEVLIRFELARAAAKSSQEFTALGLVQKVTTLAEPLLRAAAMYDGGAAAIAERTDADAARVMAALERPATTAAEIRAIDRATERLEKEDPIIAEAFTLQAARTGSHDSILRAVFTYEAPPLDGLSDAVWKTPVSPACLAEARRLVIARLSPLGAQAWRGRIIASIAAAMRAAV